MSTVPLFVQQLTALLDGETNNVTNLSNAAALLMQTQSDLNWVGFYVYTPADQLLHLGPFQGKVACTQIQPSKGVVGTAYAQDQLQLIPNVHEFAGHIACDAASQSELVVPIHVQETLVGVLDLDSPTLERFTTSDATAMQQFVQALEKHLDLTPQATLY
ncbi:GAF domain-containing protein [Lactobacillus selangorensis]|uniref:GAF domain-containing protein n=1 Tax=Lactobacillus selangorensis TaxID=81857 RepID=A0A0R2FVQ6_9LACO|nr:GAF domain-containing protein [Lactobacillus selangorensis]KRN29338.1 GAF domain-containing protein [Lactobacillus selangorensis]KRN34133.1 GAF domain-containing protein [Lactobacillus selangorensis]